MSQAIGYATSHSFTSLKPITYFCAEHGIGPDIEVIPIQEINDAYKKVEKGEVRFRYVINMVSLKQDEAN